MTAQQTDAPRPNARIRFRDWRRSRPFAGGLLGVLAGVEMFLSSQLDLKNIQFQVGIEGLQATLIPVLLIVLGVLTVTTPAHRVLYGVLTLVISVYSLIGANLGGFVVGFLLGAIGGVLVVAWMPKRSRESRDAMVDPAAEPRPFSAAPDRPRRRTRAEGPAGTGATVGDTAHADALAGAHAEYVRTVGLVAHDTVEPSPTPTSGGTGRRRAARAGAAVAAVLIASLGATGITAVGPPAANAAQPALCIPIVMKCGSTPTPTPTPTETPTPEPTATDGTTDAGSGTTGDDTSSGGAATDPGTTTAPGTDAGTSDATSAGGSSGTPADDPKTLDPDDAFVDDDAPVVTLPAAQLGGTSLSFTGIPTLAFVTLRLANGGTTTALRLTAASITINGFYLDVKGEQGGTALATIDDRMVLTGHVKAYLTSGTIALGDGTTLQLGADTPTVEDELPAETLRVTLGLIAVTADDIVHTNTHQHIHEGAH